jgi:hypothetical protein
MSKKTQKVVPTVTLARADVDHIIRTMMGWESVDVRSFWHLARNLQQGGRR